MPGPGPGVERRSLLRLGALLAAGGAAALVPAPIAHAVTRGQGTDAVTTSHQGRSPYGNDQWAYVAFDVPAGVQRISAPGPDPHQPLRAASPRRATADGAKTGPN
ncbi:hypothetical protein ACGFYQ_39710 [Streptomyces sp. NPDC048258]|uniref:hypothetical protein n=1 Tax=Streptomyces sp. NPDC048258 TaxID=3365527 RepID=UPI00370FCCCA